MIRLVAVLRKLALGLGKLLLALFVFFAIYAAYGTHAERSANRRAAAMCASIAPGDDAAPLREVALADGASEWQTRWATFEGVVTLIITYVGMPPFSRYMCRVTASGGRVVAAELGRLD